MSGRKEQKFLDALRDLFVGAQEVEFADGTRLPLSNPDWQSVKPLLWW